MRLTAGLSALVTGGAGFIGSHLAEMLEARGLHVTILDSLVTGRLEHLQHLQHAEFVELDLLSRDLEDFFISRRPDLILHFAGSGYVPTSVERPYFDFSANLHATIRLLDLVRKYCPGAAFIYASSAAVYGEPLFNPTDENCPTNPISPYGVSKLAAERYVSVYARLYGLRAASMRLFSVFGPRHRKQVVFDLIDRLHRNPMLLEVLGDGAQQRDFNYVTDVLAAALVILNGGALQGEAYNVGSGQVRSIDDLVTAIVAATGHSPSIKYSGSTRPGDPDRWEADISRLRELGYKPVVPFLEGIRRTIDWYRSRENPTLAYT